MFKTVALNSVSNAYVDKDVGGGTPGTRLESDDRNITQDELVNLVESASLTLDPTGVKRDQQAQAAFILGASAASMIDTGIAGTYVVDPVSSAVVPPDAFAEMDGVAVVFVPDNVNVGAATINYSGLGAKPATTRTGAALTGGEMSGYVAFQYNLTLDRWELMFSQIALNSFFDNTATGMTAEQVQAAIDELYTLVVAFSPFYDAYVKVSDVKAPTVDGGSIVAANVWQTRDINTIDADSQSIVSILSNQITLPAGTYDCHIISPTAMSTLSRARLYDTTGAVALAQGSQVRAFFEYHAGGQSIITGEFTITVESVLEIQHIANATKVSIGLGSACDQAENEIYTTAVFRRRVL